MAEPTLPDPADDRERDSRHWIDWNALEASLPLDELPRLHRAFLTLNDPGEDWNGTPLRRVQGKVGAALGRLVRSDRARRDGDALLVAVDALPPEFVTGAAGGDDAP